MACEGNRICYESEKESSKCIVVAEAGACDVWWWRCWWFVKEIGYVNSYESEKESSKCIVVAEARGLGCTVEWRKRWVGTHLLTPLPV